MVEGKPLIIVLYVDDLILAGDDQLIQSCKEDLAREFEMKYMGLMHYFLSMKVCQKDGEVFVSQGKYANEILRQFHMEKYKPMQTTLVGNWRKEDATSDEGFIDGDWAGREEFSTLVQLQFLGTTGNRGELHLAQQRLNTWLLEVACEAIWMWKILVGLFGQRMDPTVIYCDNQSRIKLSENPVFHDRSKHIDIQYHHLRDCVVKRIMFLLYVSTEEDNADILTKAFSKCKFDFHIDRIGVIDNPFLVEREC
eukprot:PITA_24968